MRRRYLVAFLLAAPGAAHEVLAQAIRGSGVAKSEQRHLAPFDRIDVAGAFDVTLVDGPTYRITVEADNDLLDAISSDVIDNELRISSLRSFVSRTTMKVTVESPPLRGLTVSGNAKATANALTGPNFAFAGSGSSTAKLGGSIDSLKISLAGAGRVDALDLTAESVEVEVLGSGTAEVHAVKTLSLMVIGSGTLRYRGNPKVSRNAIGRGRVEQIKN
ncbi:MAG TPA: head GIN domain-containing protein [Burkholderiaceae bacterium]|nr:head GIN domain-containing protein [Burkholderiaceae bacterium]